MCWFEGKKDQEMPIIKLGGPPQIFSSEIVGLQASYVENHWFSLMPLFLLAQIKVSVGLKLLLYSQEEINLECYTFIFLCVLASYLIHFLLSSFANPALRLIRPA